MPSRSHRENVTTGATCFEQADGKGECVEQSEMFKDEPSPRKRRRKRTAPHEWKVTSLRECPVPESLVLIEGPESAVEYWKLHIAAAPSFRPECEQVFVLILNTRLRVRGHHLVSLGGLNEAQAKPREVFRAAIIAAGYGIILMHNHPSGETHPSEGDRQVTRQICAAGSILEIPLYDHIIVGHNRYFSFREAGLV